MIETLQWCTLAACAAVALARIPSAFRRQNRTICAIFALMTLAILLSIEAPYLVIDRVLGGINIANLILRLVVFAAILCVGNRISKGFGATGASRLIAGPSGLAVLGVNSLAIMVIFFLMDTSGSSVGMAGIANLDPGNVLLLRFYGVAGRIYPAYVALVLLPAMAKATMSTLPALVRMAAFLLGAGSLAVALTLLFPLFPSAWGAALYVINYTAVLCYVFGLALIGVASLVHRRHGPRQKTSTAK
ncbi:hypothetical protein PY310_11690 [Pseudarthrobacter sp. H3Y2-7]|uniref:hypothetical protein n=1 Tax=Pseudarthrobacter naphthalenicus TaxID=3031328 RepID=UPI0023B14427|nr:hypothetical protein [Pseudarthrobacter sp. H3Y2-7]MDE8669240.1 hypothetical protein [Pseudarthrobacter sp. H3Y2-7]